MQATSPRKVQDTPMNATDEHHLEMIRHEARQAEDRAEQAVIDAAVEVAADASDANLAELRKAVSDMDAANEAAVRASQRAQAAYEGRRIY